MTRRYTRLAIIALTLIALGALAAACAPAAPAPTAVAPTVAAQPTKAAAAPTSAPAATKAAAAPAATQAAVAPTATQAAAAPTTAVSFAKDVLPIFEQNCVKCHGGDKTDAALALKTYAQLMKGSQNGPVIKAGDAKNSFLVQQIVIGKMPQRASKLPQAQIDTITAWVNAGASNN